MSDDDSGGNRAIASIAKLNETNYRAWSKRIEWILDERGLWEVVIGLEKAPAWSEHASGTSGNPATTAAAAAAASPMISDRAAMASDYQSALRAFEKKCKRARTVLGTTITDSVMTYIEGEKDPAKMWRILEDKYNPKSKVTLVQKIRELTMVKLDPGADLEAHIQRMVRLRRIVEEQGEKVSDTFFIGILLNSLSDDYAVVTSIIEGQADLPPDQVINKLMEEYRKRAQAGDSDAIAMKMRSISNGTAKNQSGWRNRNTQYPINTVKCTVCRKEGHDEPRCWIKHPEL